MMHNKIQANSGVFRQLLKTEVQNLWDLGMFTAMQKILTCVID